MEEKQHAAIIFADIKGYSALSDDLQAIVARVFDEVQTTIITPRKPLYVNTWGDAFVICLSNCADAAEIALKMRDYFKTYNWIRNHFSAPLAIRIGLHFSLISLVRESEDGPIKNVIGKGLGAGARIEPIVEPDKIFCSQLFTGNLVACDDDRFVVLPLGERELAKGFGVMNLLELRWRHESGAATGPDATPDNSNIIYIPRLPGKITDRDRRQFSTQTFQIIKDYFNKGAKEIEKLSSSIEIMVHEITATRIHVELYKDGSLENGALIWIGGAFSPFSINMSEGARLDVNNLNSYNEILAIEDKDGDLAWSATMGFYSFNNNNLGFDLKKMGSGQVAEYLWRRFID